MLDSGISATTDYEFTWYLNGEMIPGASNSTYEAQQIGNYYVSFTNIIVNCGDDSNSVSVDEIEEATDLYFTVSQAF